MRARQILDRLRHLPGQVAAAWRESIRVRVVLSIVLLSGLVVGTVGYLVTQQIADGLADARVRTALAEARNETQSARDRLGSAGGSEVDPATQLRQLVESLVSRGEVRGYDVIVLGPVDSPDQTGSGAEALSGGVRTSPDVDASSVPSGLRRQTERGSAMTWTFTRVHYTDSTRQSVPGVAVGSTVVLPTDGGVYGLYYVFPMDQELNTLNLLRRALLTSGLLLLALVAGVAWLVTRQVITPVRLARRVAERIASGRLEERMRVTGSDDLARLAISFNQMADALQAQIRQLVDLSTVQRRFVSDVSHELRTPLTTVRMASDVIHDAKDSFDPVTARAAELLQVELDRFEGLLADLLEISRFDAGAAGLELDEVDLVEVARRVVDSTVPLAARREVRVVVEPGAGPVRVEADQRRIARVVRNLVTNAIDHAGGPGSRVVVRVADGPEAAALVVRDHGVGLQPGQAAMVFNRFWRGDPARTRTSGGTGLGLAIALEDARLHGGWLEAWGAPGAGAQFRLTLPHRAGDAFTDSPLPLVPRDARVTEGSGA